MNEQQRVAEKVDIVTRLLIEKKLSPFEGRILLGFEIPIAPEAELFQLFEAFLAVPKDMILDKESLKIRINQIVKRARLEKIPWQLRT